MFLHPCECDCVTVRIIVVVMDILMFPAMRIKIVNDDDDLFSHFVDKSIVYNNDYDEDDDCKQR